MIIIKMPYGKVEINSIEEATYFIKHHCDNCHHSSLMSPCSGYQAGLCETAVQELIRRIKEIE